MIETAEQLAQVRELTGELYPLLRGKPPEIVTAALADCVARAIAGHVIPNDTTRTHELRDQLLDNIVKTIRLLIEVNAKIIHGGGEAKQ
jgi:hypothetical protein